MGRLLNWVYFAQNGWILFATSLYYLRKLNKNELKDLFIIPETVPV